MPDALHRPSLTELFATAEEWLKDGTTYTAVVMSDDGLLKETLYTVSSQELRDYHPQLLAAMQAMARRKKGTFTKQGLSGACLRHTLHHWQSPYPLMQPGARPRAVLEITQIEPQSNGMLLLSLTLLQFAYTTRRFTSADGLATSERLLLVCELMEAACAVPPDWLETAYPGWEARFDTGIGLGLLDDDLVRYVCVEQRPLALPAASKLIPAFS